MSAPQYQANIPAVFGDGTITYAFRIYLDQLTQYAGQGGGGGGVQPGDPVSLLANDVGYLTAETDPTVPGFVKLITASQISNWDTAFSWGNHATAGYATLAGTQTFTGTNTFSNTIVGSVNGNAATATALQTARAIGGVSFNGTADINLPGVNIAGNQNTTGNAATATALQTSRNINGTGFNGTVNITTANWGTARTITIGGTGKSVNGSAAVSWSLAEIGAVGITNTETITGAKTFSALVVGSRAAPGVIAVATQGEPGFEALTSGAGNAAYVTFHRSGAFAIRFGLDTDNRLKFGGWSEGAASYEIWHTKKTLQQSLTGTAVDWSVSTRAFLTRSASATLTFTNPTTAGQSLVLVLSLSSGAAITWPAAVRWPGGAAPTLGNGKHFIGFYWDGTNYLGGALVAYP